MNDSEAIHLSVYARVDEFKTQRISRREFLAQVTAKGVTVGAAYMLIGEPQPAMAAGVAKQGGTLRIAAPVREIREPRMMNSVEMGNIHRGFFEYLVEYQNDGSFVPMLLESWEVNDDASQYTLRIRPGIKWSNGEDFTAEHVAHAIESWCDKSVEGNTMQTRMGSMIDAETGKATEGAISVTDPLTVVLKTNRPDITIIPTLADYPASIAHPDFDPQDLTTLIGTGPYRLAEHEVGVRAVIERDTDREWWGSSVMGGAMLDRIEYIDFGVDMVSSVAAVESEEVDMLSETTGEFIQVLDGLGWTKSEVTTGQTIVIRPQQKAEVDGKVPYSDKRVRRALALAVDNAIILELGYSSLGTTAENHHVAPVHPEYAELAPIGRNVEEANRLMEEAGMMDFEHQLTSIDAGWMKDTVDAIAAQLRDAGFKVSRKVVPSEAFWNDWNKFPFSGTNWSHRPLGVQNLNLAYRSDGSWNESGFANAEFDSLIDEALKIADAEKRRELMFRIETILQEEGVIIQPYWRSLYRHYRPDVVGAEMHVAREIYPYKLGFAA